ncbi:MFS transporter [Streptomyces marianii]|uniref:MFS transporter n=1 Tax=Streptomyces marianii TaxID=1817406 RepID=A0A5R9EBL1_9ACTN|nr:MFS transporter [Streptomyces marianii]
MITGRAQGTAGQRDRAVLVACATAGFTTLLDNSALNVALPSLRLSLAADVHQMQWIAAGYSLMFALALVPGGRLGDAHGRKPYFVAGMAVFVVGGILAAVSSDAWLLVACRLVQGAGAGLINGQMIGIIQDSFTGTARARALGVYAAAASTAAALGPALGGALIAAAARIRDGAWSSSWARPSAPPLRRWQHVVFLLAQHATHGPRSMSEGHCCSLPPRSPFSCPWSHHCAEPAWPTAPPLRACWPC